MRFLSLILFLSTIAALSTPTAAQTLQMADGQVLLAQDAGLCDFDRACAGPLAMDLASFHAHAVAEDESNGAAFAHAFVEAYGRGGQLPPARELAWWNAAALARMAASPFRSLRADWPEACERLLAHAAKAAQEARA